MHQNSASEDDEKNLLHLHGGSMGLQKTMMKKETPASFSGSMGLQKMMKKETPALCSGSMGLQKMMKEETPASFQWKHRASDDEKETPALYGGSMGLQPHEQALFEIRRALALDRRSQR